MTLRFWCFTLLALLLCPFASHSEPVGNRITNLYDAFGKDIPGLTQDFGFSALIEWEGKKILFDAGSDAEIQKQNAKTLGVDLSDVDLAVASHSHFDHINGFDYLLTVNPDVKIYFPSDPFIGAPFVFDVTGTDSAASNALSVDQRYFRGGNTRFTFEQSGRFWKSNIEFVSESREILPGLNLVTTRSPFLGYFSRYPNLTGFGEATTNDEINTTGLPELSLTLETEKGTTLIVGCSHSLVETITREARSYLGRDIGFVQGGFHLLPYKGDEIGEMAQRMRDELGVSRVAPAHCTGHLGFKVFSEIFGPSYVQAGLGAITDF